MAWHRPGMGVVLAGACCWLSGGCADIPDWAKYQHSAALEITDQSMPQINAVRSQSSDGVKLQTPTPGPAPQVFAPQQEKEIVPASATASRGQVRISICAWVNGQPIFDEEVRQTAGGALKQYQRMPEPQRSEKVAETMEKVREHLIDLEVMYQDAIKRLTQNGDSKKNPLDKLNEFVDQEFNKEVRKWREGGAPEAMIQEIEPIRHRMMKRELIATEYARTLLKPKIDRVSPDDIREYYEEHKNLFLTVDRLEWQDIFIQVSPDLPTVADVKRFAEEQIARCRTPEDFNKLMVYNTGVTANSGSEGLGNLRGQIHPPELEQTLFNLREGEIGPVVPMANGVHLIRVTKREYAGQKPFDYLVQKTVRKELEKERADRAYKRLVRELRDRAIIRLESETR